VTPTGLESFGERLLACCFDSKELFDLAAVSVGFDNVSMKYECSDFIGPVDNLIFGGMLDFNTCWIPGNPWPRSRGDWVKALLPHFSLCFQKNRDFPDAFRAEALQRVVRIPAAYPGDFDLICDGLIDYIMGVRYHRLEGRTKKMDPAARRKAYEDTAMTVRIPSARVLIQDNDSILDQIFATVQPTKPFRTGVRAFDHYYGDRAMGGDAWLAFGHPGGGKTNLACQTAGFTAADQKLVAYVTTEVKKPTILQRCCSAESSIPYNILKAMSGNRGHPQAAVFSNWVATIGRNITIFDYRDVEGKDYKEKYRRMMDAFYKQHGRMPDLTIWDWIGKALDAGFADPWAKREAYNGVAAMLVDSADEYDNATLTLAQANKESKNRSNLTEQDTADSRSLCDGMEGVVGITSLLDNSENNAGSQECHKEIQSLVICKCREEQALRLQVRRRFDLARFESVT
jgi:hypothetical protein